MGADPDLAYSKLEEIRTANESAWIPTPTDF